MKARLFAPVFCTFIAGLGPGCTCSETRRTDRNPESKLSKEVAQSNADPGETGAGPPLNAAIDAAVPSRNPKIHVWRPSSLAAVVLSPSEPLQERAPLPVLFVFHGRGEALKGKELGMYGWANDYELTSALTRISGANKSALRDEDFYGFVSPERLTEMNTALQRQPFRDMVIVCPYLPDFSLHNFSEVRPYATRFKKEFVDHLEELERIIEAPIDRTRLSIDGVSLGGLAALWIGSEYPATFAAVGALQPALFSRDAAFWSARLAKARSLAPALSIRLVTSEEDFYRGAVETLDRALSSNKIAHAFFLARGPHDYVFNRGPGAYELLFWHERTLYSR